MISQSFDLSDYVWEILEQKETIWSNTTHWVGSLDYVYYFPSTETRTLVHNANNGLEVSHDLLVPLLVVATINTSTVFAFQMIFHFG